MLYKAHKGCTQSIAMHNKAMAHYHNNHTTMCIKTKNKFTPRKKVVKTIIKLQQQVAQQKISIFIMARKINSLKNQQEI